MKQYKLSRQPAGATLTKFFVYDGASTVGIITVPNEEANDLQKHWAPPPQAAAAVTPARNNPNPMVNAMLRAARKHSLNRKAILRGC